MAHQSGYGGTMSMATGPTGLVALGPLQAFIIRQNRGVFEAFGKGEGWVTTFPTVKRWSADVTTLLPDSAARADFGFDAMVSPATGVKFAFNTSDDLTGEGHIENCVLEDPLDGPVLARLAIRGNGALVSDVAP